MSSERTRYLVLAPAVDGADGISELSRQVIRTLVAQAGGEGVDVWALAGGMRPQPPGESAPAFRTAHGRRRRMTQWALARAAAKCHGLTVVVLHTHLAPLGALLAWRGAQLAVFLIGIEVWQRLRVRERVALERADRLIAISQHTARRFAEANPGLRVRALTVCPLGVGARKSLPAAARTDEGFGLIVGRMRAQERYKGHDRLIDIWPAVRTRVPGARLLVVGEGDDRARLEARVAAEGLGGAIRFVGQVTDDELAHLYRAAAFFVMPSTGEGFGLAYLEAMRAGKPCIACHGAADEIIDNGVNGILVDTAATDPLTDAVVRLFTDDSLRARMGAAAAVRIVGGFTSEHFATRFRDALGLSSTATPAACEALEPGPAASMRIGSAVKHATSGGAPRDLT